MNQILTIRNLNALMNGEKSILNMDTDGFLTPDWMMDKGIWSCYSCGYLNCIESNRCEGCNDEKFILTESNKNLFVDVDLDVRPHIPERIRYRRKPVIDTVTGQMYGSVTIAAENHNMSTWMLSQILKGRMPNTVNLKYKL